MYKNKSERDRPLYVLITIAYLFVVYIAIATAPFASNGLPSIIANWDNISLSPTALEWTPITAKTIFLFSLIYFAVVSIALTYKRRYHRRGVENGSADYANIKQLQREFNSKSKERIVYTERFALSVAKEDMYKHKRNYNTLVVGGPGSNKTRGLVYPNLLEASASYVVLDPKGEINRNTARYLQQKGYKVKVVNLINPNYSWGYNPFHYIHQDTATEQRADDDIQRIVTAIYKSTTVPNSQTIDPFWDEAGKMLLSSLMYLLYYFGAEEEKNFPYLMNLIRAGRIENSEDDTEVSPLDLLFMGIEREYPNHIAVRYYKNATSGAGKTQQSVQATLLARLQKFELSSIGAMMSIDELELEKLAVEPTALYLVIPDNDTSYNFIISLFYIQLFQILYDQADFKYKGRLPRFVHIFMDEFANVHTPEDFLSILGGCRGRNIGICIILQNLSQLKAKYKDGWENIIGQCDEFLYLGGNEQSTHEYVSKMLGSETIDTTSSGRRYGIQGDSSTNYQFAGRELLKPDEVRKLPYDYAILIIKNSAPLIDKKIDISKYKKAKGTAIRGNKDLEYTIPLRSARLELVSSQPQTDESNIFDATVVGDEIKGTELKLQVNSKMFDIYDVSIYELIESYYISSEELENYLKYV